MRVIINGIEVPAYAHQVVVEFADWELDGLGIVYTTEHFEHGRHRGIPYRFTFGGDPDPERPVKAWQDAARESRLPSGRHALGPA